VNATRVNTDDPDAWTVAGELTFASVPALQEHSPGWFSSPPKTLDLAGVERIDSAGIALVIEWARRARLAGGDMRMLNVPASMTSLARTTGIERLLNIDGSS